MIVAFYHCKYLFKIEIMVETTKLLSMRTELPVVTVTLWLNNVMFLLRIEPEVCKSLVMDSQTDRMRTRGRSTCWRARKGIKSTQVITD